MKLPISLSLLCLIFLSSCNQAIKNDPPSAVADSTITRNQNPNWIIKTIQEQWQTGSCDIKDESCFEISVSYPQFKEDDSKLLKRVNQSIEKTILKELQAYKFSEEKEATGKNFDQIVAEIFVEFNQLLEDSPRLIANHWTIELNGEKSSETDNTITVALAVYSYTGGAHPNSYKTYLNFNKATGELVELTDMITDRAAVLKLAEQKFREAYDLTPDQPLTAAGLFENQLTLPENFAITPEGLLLFYNTYEIAPYVAGTYQLMLPWEQLSGIDQ